MKNITKLTFKRFIMTIGNLPSSYVDSLSYYECLVWLCNYLENTVIPTVNNNGEAVEELQEKFIELKNYVDTYFENLDVQKEINNKLDDMVESGELEQIIATYIQSNGVISYKTLTELIASENLFDGMTVETMGNTTYLDGGGRKYLIREIINTDVIDGVNKISLTHYDNLIAELIPVVLYNEYNKNIIYKNYYEFDTNIYITEVHNVESIQILPTNDNYETPAGLDSTNINQYILDHPTLDYDIISNCCVGNNVNHTLIGYVIFDGVGYDSGVTTSDTAVIGFDNNLNMSSIRLRDTSLEECESLYQNAFTGFGSLIQNYNDVNPLYTATATTKFCLGQLEDKTLIYVYADCRKPLNADVTWEDLRTFIKSKYPTIKELCVLDGGGSAQLYNKDYSIIPSSNIVDYMGRKVYLALALKVQESGDLL